MEEGGGQCKCKRAVGCSKEQRMNAPLFPLSGFQAILPWVVTSFCESAARRLFGGCAATAGCNLRSSSDGFVHEDDVRGKRGRRRRRRRSRRNVRERRCVDGSWVKQGVGQRVSHSIPHTQSRQRSRHPGAVRVPRRQGGTFLKEGRRNVQWRRR
jgi:hypothetical protein